MTEAEILISVLKHSAGFDVGLLGSLEIRSLDDNTFAVWTAEDPTHEFIFPTAEMAVAYFIESREALALGVDFESG